MACALALTMAQPVHAAEKTEIKWDRHSLLFDGHRVVPVMGEVHYSRIPAGEWAHSVRMMKEGGVTIIATYVFWNHIEEEEGIFRWDGQRNLRAFLEVCQQEQMPVVLRIGPFCHGEVRHGGIPDWMLSKGCKMRSEDPVFLHFTERLYRQIFTQVQGLQWKDGGPVIACQFDNEYRGRGTYLLALKKIANNIGFDLPFYTRTGWPELATPVPFGEMLPLYGDYADGFWERSLAETAGNYYKAFHFRAPSLPAEGAMGDMGGERLKVDGGVMKADAEGMKADQYPYFTCELGGGMMTAYHRRPYLYPEDAYSMAVVKLGSGSNLLGYYMYHGGTNPEGKTWLNEMQRTLVTNYNDLPVKTYDFQAPLGEFGQANPHYYLLRKLHLFMHDFGELLAPMEAVFPCQQDIPKGDDSFLRWSYRTVGGQQAQSGTSNSAFVFYNNYERLQPLTDKRNIQFNVCGVLFPRKPITVPANSIGILPVNIPVGKHLLRYATAQLVAQRTDSVTGTVRVWLQQLPGIPTEICINGKTLSHVKVKGPEKAVYSAPGLQLFLINEQQAGHLFLPSVTLHPSPVTLYPEKIQSASQPRTITIGVQKVAEEPTDDDFSRAAVYRIPLPADLSREGKLIDIDYQGDCARLYAGGQLIDDNFYNGRHFQYALWRLPAECSELELRILPLQEQMPVYLPREARQDVPERVNSITIINR